jgi:ankyrin repeat protein
MLMFLLDRTNNDQLTPIHQAASEGHVQCLELLLAHNADVYAEDNRKQLPIDLAKLWGNKKCAKLLATAMWHQNKHLSAKERLLSRNTKMADLLLEIKRDHAILFEEKAEVSID